MTHLEHIAARVIGQPLLIMPQKLAIIAQVLAGRIGLDIGEPELGLESVARPAPLASRFVGSARDTESGARLPYLRTEGGAALITTTGSLVNRGAWIGANSGVSSYEGIAAQFRAAATDPKVTSILHDLNTPGGEATGAFELAGLIAEVNTAKPVTAFVNGLAASAGLMLASAAGRIVSVPSGLSGSIGVVMMHADYSRALDRAGITPTLIYSGSHKVDANPYKPLDPETAARLQAEVDAMREDFVQLVAKGRGARMSAKAIRDTEAAIFSGKEALAIGLVDELTSFDTLFETMNRSAARSRPATRRASMNFTQADLDAARAEGKAEGHAAGRAEGHAAGLSEGRIAGAEAERTRIKAIVGSPEANGRETLAAHYAYETNEDPARAEAALKAAPKASAASGLSDRAEKTERGFHTAETGKRAPATIDAAAIYGRMNGQPSN